VIDSTWILINYLNDFCRSEFIIKIKNWVTSLGTGWNSIFSTSVSKIFKFLLKMCQQQSRIQSLQTNREHYILLAILYTKCVCTYFFLADKFESYNFRKKCTFYAIVELYRKKPDKYAFNVKQFDRIGSRLFCISMLRCVYTSDFLMHFPHCIAIFYYLPWLSKTKISYK